MNKLIIVAMLAAAGLMAQTRPLLSQTAVPVPFASGEPQLWMCGGTAPGCVFVRVDKGVFGLAQQQDGTVVLTVLTAGGRCRSDVAPARNSDGSYTIPSLPTTYDGGSMEVKRNGLAQTAVPVPGGEADYTATGATITPNAKFPWSALDSIRVRYCY